MLTMTTLSNTASSDIPQVSYMKAIDIYLFVAFIMVFLSLIEYAIVGYLAYKINKQHDDEKQRRRISKLGGQLESNLYPVQSGKRNKTGYDNNNFRYDADEPKNIELLQVNNTNASRSNSISIQDPQAIKKYLYWMQKVNSIDYSSRWIFPLSFSLFNLAYVGVLWTIDREQTLVLDQFTKY